MTIAPCVRARYIKRAYHAYASFKKQDVALTGRSRTGPPCSVGRPHDGSVTDDRRQRAKNTGPLGGRRVSNKVRVNVRTFQSSYGTRSCATFVLMEYGQFIYRYNTAPVHDIGAANMNMDSIRLTYPTIKYNKVR